MSCSNCFNNCDGITSDKCIMYTGIDVPVLGIKKGDSLSYVEQSLITFLLSVIDGTGMKPNIPDALVCNYISTRLQECSTVTALDLFKALISAACDLDQRIINLNNFKNSLEGPYTVGCLSGVNQNSGTHAILQAVINKLCQVDSQLASHIIDVNTNFVKLSDLNTLIQNYLDSLNSQLKYYKRMIPYVIYPFFGTLTKFDSTGAGLDEWEKVYLCNGNNGTPDLRGRAIVGAIQGVPGGTLPPEVDPGMSSFNPNYAKGSVAGTNSVQLTVNQIPAHNHSVNDPGHHHLTFRRVVDNTNELVTSSQYPASERTSPTTKDYSISASNSPADVGRTTSSGTGISVGNTGGSMPHANIQPVMAVYYIMHIP